MNSPIRRTRPEKTGLNAPLGDLEQIVMHCVWGSGDAGVLGSDVQSDLDKHRPIAITTVLTTLERLRDKGILRRERVGKAYRYWATVAEAELQQRIVGGVLDRLIAQFPQAVATYFSQRDKIADQVGENEALRDLARELEHLNHLPKQENDHGH